MTIETRPRTDHRRRAARSYLLVAVTALGLAATFMIYSRVQTPSKAREPGVINPPADPLRKDDSHLGSWRAGSRVDIKQFSKDTGEISSEMQCDDYTTRKDGTITVTHPIAKFFLANHQMVAIHGVDGEIVENYAPDLTAATASRQPMGLPNRGKLRQVKIMLYPTWVERNPTLTLVTNNIVFDNDTFRISTGPFKAADGTIVSADEVPVAVTGSEYDFNGRGMTLQWNDQDGRLELLEIAHGEQLTIKNASDFTGPSGSPKEKTPPAGVSLGNQASPAALPLLASRDPADTALALKPGPKPTPATKPRSSRVQPLYLATFEKSVRITQGPGTLVTADLMDVDFLLKSGSSGGPATGPATAPSAEPPDAVPSAPVPPTTQDAAALPPDPSAADEPVSPAPAAAPSTQPHREPVIITWVGKLRVVPAPRPPAAPVLPGNAIVTLVGSPVVARHADVGQNQWSEARCASLLYFTGDGSVWLHHSDALPQVSLTKLPVEGAPLTSSTRVDADSIDYHASEHIAILTGNGKARLPLTSAGAANKGTMDASWKQGGKLWFAPRAEQAMAVERAEFSGDVDVNHPQLALKSQWLQLSFDPPGAATRPASASGSPNQVELRRMVATDDVDCRLTDSAGKKQTIDCARLELLTAHAADGKLFPHQVYADGDVHASDIEQDLRAGHVELTLAPAAKAPALNAPPRTQPAGLDDSSVQLQSMTAHGNVKVTSKAGAVATADDLSVVTEHEQTHVCLSSAQSLAKVRDANNNVLTGPTIKMDPKTQEAHVIGPGTLHTLRQEQPGEPAKPMDVLWSDRADLDGAADRIDVRGKVVVTERDPDGSLNTAHSEHMRIDLEKKPVAVTASATIKRQEPDTRPAASASAGAGQMDFLKDKQARKVTLDEDAVVKSTLADATGAVLREFELKAPSISYVLGGDKEHPGRSVLVPSAGQMLVRDYRAPNKQSTDADSGLGGDRGATAFQWQKQLVYHESDRKAVMTGDVVIVHQAEDGGDPARVNADEVTANFQPPAATRPAEQAKEPGAPMQVKSISARGNVVITRGTSQITGDQLDFDPATHWIAVRGTQHTATFTDGTGRSTNASEVQWNAQTWNVRFKDATGRFRQ